MLGCVVFGFLETMPSVTFLFLLLLFCCCSPTRSSHTINFTNGIMMDQNTALNGPTITTTTKDYDGKKKKNGYGPIIVVVSLALLLGLAFYAARSPNDDSFHYDEMGMTNVVASSSSSLSFVGSGTAASVSSGLKTVGPGES